MSAVSGVVGALYIEDSVSTFTGEASTLQADMKTLLITDATVNMLKDDPTLFTIYKGGVEVTDQPFQVYIDRVVFDEVQGAGVYTIDGSQINVTQAGGFYEWGLDVKHNVQDCTVWGTEWESKIKGVRSFTASAKRYWIDSVYLDAMAAGLPILARFFTDIDNYNSYMGYVQVSGEKIGSKLTGIVESEISFVGTKSLVYSNQELPS